MIERMLMKCIHPTYRMSSLILKNKIVITVTKTTFFSFFFCSVFRSHFLKHKIVIMVTKNNLFQLLLLLSIQLLLNLRPITGQHSLKLKSGVEIRCFENERQALLKFKQVIIDEYGRLSTWGFEENKRDCCKWRGVYCHNQTNHVTRLDLRAPSGSNRYDSIAPLQGKLISPSLLELQHLEYLDLSLNHFDGAPIPEFIGSFINLCYLNLSHANFYGSIPHHIGNLSKLQYLDLENTYLSGQLFELMMNLSGPIETKLLYLNLGSNMISGSFPDARRFSSLMELRLGGCQLTGSIPAPNLRLPNLVVLDLSDNNLTGPVPDLSFCTSLKVLDLENNKFSGTLTKSIGGLSKLEFLSLGSNLLQDIITEDHLFNLSRLQMLDLSSNSLLNITFRHPPFQLKYARLSNCKLGPQFPKWIQNQKKLIFLDISFATISDVIPSWFGNLASKLVHLNASNNQIFGFFPNILPSAFNSTYNWEWSKHGPSLEYPALDLSRNNISGSVNFLCHTPYLAWIDLSDNQLSNQLPNCFANFEFLRYLDLTNNYFSGKIPPSFGSLRRLSWLHLRNNSLSGEIPASMKNCKNLMMLDLGENKLTGKVPAWIRDEFPKLSHLRLSSNEFFGSIPSSICGLLTLTLLDLSSNNIHGVIPKCLSNLTAMTTGTAEFQYAYSEDIAIWFSLKVSPTHHDCMHFMWKGKEVVYVNHFNPVNLIDLSNNRLVGEIPAEITKLHGLISLNFSRNNLTGYIPQNIDELRDLNTLDLSRNHLSGSIPAGLSELSHLGFLNLSYNNLSGRIPDNSHMLTIDESAYIGNPGLCGHLILNKSCPGDDETDKHSNFNPEHEEEDDDGDKFITQGFYITMALGFVIGFYGICGTILFKESREI